MKILKNARKIILIIFVLVIILNTFVYADYNPPREELEKMIEEVAIKRGIPPVILKSIARVESVFEHYNRDGSPKISGTSIGLMQINNKHGGYDTNKLKYDIMYNIEAGADVLLNKWSMSSYQSVASVGNMDPNVLENWYFALWAYNGWAQSNNPHMLSSYAKKYTYQQLIYDIAKKEYGQTINNIDFSYLPTSGKPSRSLVVPTPAYTNSGNIVLYEKGDYVRTDGIRDVYQLRDEPAGRYIYDLAVNTLAIVDEGPVLKNGYYWYKVIVNENVNGWIERNWLTRTGDTEYGRYVFGDISYHWGRKLIMDLYNEGIVSEAPDFNPDNIITKEEFLILLSKSLDKYGVFEHKDEDTDEKIIENKENRKNKDNKDDNDNKENKDKAVLENEKLPFTDAGDIHPWATEYIIDLAEQGLLSDYENELKPLDSLTRKEAANIIKDIFDEDDEYKDLDINVIFNDLTTLSEEEINAVKKAYVSGVISGKGSGIFCPDDYLTRAEAAAIMAKICNKLSQSK